MKKTFLLFFTLVFANMIFAQNKEYKVATLGFYNLENLFDTENDPAINDEEFTPTGGRQWDEKKYSAKLENLSKVISELGSEHSKDGLALLGVAEIENRRVLEDLVKQPAIKDRNYQIIHYDSPDWRGIDCALLYNPKYFTPTGSKAIPLELYNDNGERRYTRDILYVSGMLDGEEIHVFVNHWPSRRGGERASAPKRNKGAQTCQEVINGILKKDKKAKVFVMGDLNDDPVSDSVTKFIKGKKKKDRIKTDEMFNPWIGLYKKGIGTLAYRDAWSLFDQILMTKGAVKDSDGYFFHQARVYNPKYLVQPSGRYKGYPFRTYGGGTYQGGYSDHYPVYISLLKEVKRP